MRWLENWLLDWSIRYGWRPWRLLQLGILLALIWKVVFWLGEIQGAMVSMNEFSTAPFQAPVYAFDVFLPMLDLGQASAWRPDMDVYYWGWIAQLCVLAAKTIGFGVATGTGSCWRVEMAAECCESGSWRKVVDNGLGDLRSWEFDMEMRELGATGLLVSRLCFGTGLMGRLEHEFTAERGGELLRYAFDRGVNFWDTAISYASHPHVKAGLAGLNRSAVIINTKTQANGKAEGKREIDRALEEMGTDYVDSMMLHAVKSRADFESRRGCLEALLEAKADGRVRHVGATTHIYTGEVFEALIEAPDIEVVLSHLNKAGQGLVGGNLEDHMALLKRVREEGKGLMIMKILDQARSPKDEIEEWIRWGFEYPHADSVDLGLNAEDKIDMAVRLSSPVPVV